MSGEDGQAVGGRLEVPEGSVVVVVSGPGGAGKGTLVDRLLLADPRLWLSRSWTTRSRRPGEAEDAYVFVTRDAFEERIAGGGFLEWVEFLDYLQGSPVPEPPEGCDVLFEIDVEGGARIKTLHPEALLVYIDAPDVAELARRLRSRGDTEEHVAKRLERALEEERRASELGYEVVVNDDLDRAVAEVRKLIESARGPLDDAASGGGTGV